jgi:peptidoglycan/LPS O-acetylase OafA/YrhL
MKKIGSLQTLRLIAATSIFQYHLWNNYLDRKFDDPGTDTFLVLAGIVAAIVDTRYISNGQWGKYIWGRYLRLYVTFIPVFLLYILAGRDVLTTEYVLKSFFLIPLYDQLPLVGPSWMISMFLVFYWLFSLAILFRREQALIPIFGLWGAGCALYYWLNIKPDFHPEWIGTIFDLRTLELILGYVTGKLIASRRVTLQAGSWLLFLGVVALVGGIIQINIIDPSLVVTERVFFYGIPMTLVALGLVTLEQQGSQNRLFQLFTHPWLVWLGGTSYVLFLIHNMIIRVWDTVIPITVIQTPLIFIVVVIAAALGYQYWEKPVLAFVHRQAG